MAQKTFIDKLKPPGKNGVIAALLLIAAIVGGLATFKENVGKLFAGFGRQRIVFKAEGMIFDPKTPTVKSLNLFQFTPTDAGYHVQQITFRYPLKFDYAPISTSYPESRLDPLLMKVQPLLLAEAQLEHPGGLAGTRCQLELPLVIESDFIDQESKRHLDDSMYFLDVDFDFQVSPFAYARAFKFDHEIGYFENREKTLDRAFALAKPSCHPVPIIPKAFQQILIDP